MVRRGIVHHSVPVTGLTHLEALAGNPVKILAAYLSPSRPHTDRSGPVRLFRRGTAGFDGRRPQRQTRGLEVAAEHKEGEPPA